MTNTLINVAEAFNLTEGGGLAGQSPLVRRQYSPQRKALMLEARRMWDGVFVGDPRAALQVREALSTSDLFKSVTGEVLDQQLLAAYQQQPTQWSSFATRTTVRNFKKKRLVDILGGNSALSAVPELSEYPGGDYRRRESFIKVGKFGRVFGFSWESLINDDLDELMTVPNAYASAAALTEENAALSIVANADGSPNTAFFKDHSTDTDSDGVVIPNGPNTTPGTGALTTENLAAAITTVKTRKDSDGNIVAPDQLVLMVGPANEMAARQILNATEIRLTSGSRTSVMPNYMAGVVTLVVHNRLQGNAWYLLPAPTSARPAVAVAFLTGYDTPDIRQKADAGVRVGGGAIDPSEGSFEVDGIYYRVRHVVGGASVDPLHTYASTGAGS